MERIDRAVHQICKIGLTIGTVFLFINAFLIVVNIVTRGLGSSIAGAYELVVLFIVPPVSFALLRTTLDDAHVSVKFLQNSFSPRVRRLQNRFVWLVTLFWWVLLTWAGIDIMLEKWTRESSELLKIPYLPFRFVWIFALILLCAASFLHLWRATKEGSES